MPILEPGFWIKMVYDERLGQVMLVNGGPEHGKPANAPVELWGWDGAAWTLLAADPNGPRWRNSAVVAYDAARGTLVLMGGSQPNRSPLREMWQWDGSAWTRYDGELPPGPGYGSMVYDAARERLVLFGGNDADYNLLGDTWEWDGVTWTQVSTTGPAPRFPGAMVYDPARQAVVLFGGHSPSPTGDFQDWGDTWSWDGTRWSEVTPPEPVPSVRPATEAAWDGVTERVLLYGGVPAGNGDALADTWAWDGAVWTQLEVDGPGPREWQAMAYDAARRVVVLFGGFDQPAYLGEPARTDTWEWDGTGWRCAAGC